MVLLHFKMQSTLFPLLGYIRLIVMKCLLLSDMRNAFNLVSRESLLSECSKKIPKLQSSLGSVVLWLSPSFVSSLRHSYI